jgi:hypothetical protein
MQAPTNEEVMAAAVRATAMQAETEVAFAKAKSPDASQEDFEALARLMGKIAGGESGPAN